VLHRAFGLSQLVEYCGASRCGGGWVAEASQVGTYYLPTSKVPRYLDKPLHTGRQYVVRQGFWDPVIVCLFRLMALTCRFQVGLQRINLRPKFDLARSIPLTQPHLHLVTISPHAG
jgi:hypothetical protein